MACSAENPISGIVLRQYWRRRHGAGGRLTHVDPGHTVSCVVQRYRFIRANLSRFKTRKPR
jgi:hypothetical protein